MAAPPFRSDPILGAVLDSSLTAHTQSINWPPAPPPDVSWVSPPPRLLPLVWLLPVSPDGLQQPGLTAPALTPHSTQQLGHLVNPKSDLATPLL